MPALLHYNGPIIRFGTAPAKGSITPKSMKLLPRISKFIIQLSRRRVIRAVGIYLVTLWLLSQGVADLFPAFGLPNWSVRAFVILGLTGLPIAIYLAWRYELTPQGLIPDTAAIDSDMTLVDYPEAGVLTVSWKDLSGNEKSSSFHSEFVVGRESDVPVQVADARVSRRHARLFPKEGSWWVEDLSSSNGTFVDGQRVKCSQLTPQAQLRLHPQGPVLTLEIVATD